jgi:Microtubule-binding protein MIP-T3 C-terminal region
MISEPQNAAPTEIQSKLVKDIMSRQAEQEAARKASNEQKEAADESKREEDVRGIRIGKLRKTGAEKGGKGPVTVGTNFGDGDMERLRLAIQVLVQHTGPLGTCMDYVQEDISLMTGELQKWGEECRKYEAEMEIEKKKSSDLLRPLQVEYSELEEQLLEQKAKISSTKASIARNDERIQQILKLVASS